MKAGVLKEKIKPIAPFKIKQALVGLSLEDSDNTVLDYLGFLTEQIPVNAACFVHVIPFIELFEKRNEEDEDLKNYEIEDAVVSGVAASINSKIASKNKVQVDFDVEEGNPLDELLQKATVLKSDLVVIGKNTHHDKHGILAKNFARKVSGNALMIPDKTKASLKSILVPFDFSPNSTEALRTAIAVCKSMPEPPVVIALNIYELPPMQAYLIRRTEDELRSILVNDRKAAFKTLLHNFIPIDDHRFIQTEIIEQTHAGIGNIIMEYAAANNIDMVVMGAKGHSRLGLLLLGSITEKVLSLTVDTPVLVVKQ